MKGGKLIAVLEHVYSATRPQIAAGKAIRHGLKLTCLREHGTKKVHVFTGHTVIKIADNPTAPDWIKGKPATQARTKKIGILHFDDLDTLADELPARVEGMMGK